MLLFFLEKVFDDIFQCFAYCPILKNSTLLVTLKQVYTRKIFQYNQHVISDGSMMSPVALHAKNLMEVSVGQSGVVLEQWDGEE